MTRAVRVRTLSDEEARAVLARQRVGRIAYALNGSVDIEPLHYAFDGHWIYARTSPGAKLASLAHRPWCAFETDEVRGDFEWTSVVAKGSVHLLDPETGSTDTYDRALEAVRSIVPQTFTSADPVPHRGLLLGVYVQELTGRSASA
jgi:nitroimidazol reductase NimA-like FMN-containing flavoprotein (pyridoxamine 5'-phosphate oxidase superfamily)